MPKIPGVNHRRAVKALSKVGFTVVREGKHIVMSDGRRILTIPRANPVNAFTIGGIVRALRGYHALPESLCYWPPCSLSFGRIETLHSDDTPGYAWPP